MNDNLANEFFST